jgi:hypothetical protein
MRTTSRGAGSRAGALSGAPEVSHSIVTMKAPWTSEDANEGRPLRRASDSARLVVVKMSASGSLTSPTAAATRRRASIPARIASRGSKKAVPERGRTDPASITASTASRVTPAARAISSTVKTSERTDISVVQIKANPLPHVSAQIPA